MNTVLPTAFYQRTDVVAVARDLVGKVLATRHDGVLTAGRIVETEAYCASERACHAYGSRRTPRTEVFFGPGGRAYVYLIYGMYELFNVVTGPPGHAAAVLIRAIEPLVGVETMRARRQNPRAARLLTAGPGRLTRALGIGRPHNGNLLTDDPLWIADDGYVAASILVGLRINVGYAGADAALPWRFGLAGSGYLSKPFG